MKLIKCTLSLTEKRSAERIVQGDRGHRWVSDEEPSYISAVARERGVLLMSPPGSGAEYLACETTTADPVPSARRAIQGRAQLEWPENPGHRGASCVGLPSAILPGAARQHKGWDPICPMAKTGTDLR